MASINMDRVVSKVKKYMKTDDMQKKQSELVNQMVEGKYTMEVNSGRSAHSAEEAAQKFIDVLTDILYNYYDGEGIDNAINTFNYSKPYQTSKNRYRIDINFDTDLQRPSLYPAGYPEGINNLAALYNNGAKGGEPMHQVSGTWHGHRIKSRTIIPGSHFMQDAKEEFMAQYGTEYNVLDVIINDDYGASVTTDTGE